MVWIRIGIGIRTLIGIGITIGIGIRRIGDRDQLFSGMEDWCTAFCIMWVWLVWWFWLVRIGIGVGVRHGVGAAEHGCGVRTERA